MSDPVFEKFKIDPTFYGIVWCDHCKKHINANEFVWANGDRLDRLTTFTKI